MLSVFVLYFFGLSVLRKSTRSQSFLSCISLRTSIVIKNVGSIKVSIRAMLLIRSIWPSRPDLIQRLLLLLLSGIYCGLSWWFQQGWVELSCVVKGGLVVTWPRYLEGKEILKWWLAGLDDSSLCLCSPFFFPHFNYNPFTRGWAKEKFRAGSTDISQTE